MPCWLSTESLEAELGYFAQFSVVLSVVVFFLSFVGVSLYSLKLLISCETRNVSPGLQSLGGWT